MLACLGPHLAPGRGATVRPFTPQPVCALAIMS
jgi:hypothetical protein